MILCALPEYMFGKNGIPEITGVRHRPAEEMTVKKILACILMILLLCMTALPAFAAEEEPYFLSNPASATYPEGAVAMYSCKAFGNNLTFEWYLVYEGNTYPLSAADGSQPWAAHTTNMGVTTNGMESLCFFEGILPGLSGAELYCVVEDGHYSVRSTTAVINVGGSAMPPQINVVGSMEVWQGDLCDLYCGVTANGSESYSYLWYKTDTGRLQDIIAVDRGDATADTLSVDTSVTGLSYYVCLVTGSGGGSVYSPVIPVLVMERPQAPQLLTKSLPEATVGESYYAKLESTGTDVQFYEYYAPGEYDSLESIGLTMSAEGEIDGVPKKAGEYSIALCAGNVSGEAVLKWTFVVKDPAALEVVSSEQSSVASSIAASSVASASADTGKSDSGSVSQSNAIAASRKPTLKPAGAADASSAESVQESVLTGVASESGTVKPDSAGAEAKGFPWWGILLAALVAAGAGAGVVLLITKKKKKR